jgi:cytochrome c oxidase subunit 1
MPRRIPDYPDAFAFFNQIASYGSYISVFSAVFFVFIILEAFGVFKLSIRSQIVEIVNP